MFLFRIQINDVFDAFYSEQFRKLKFEVPFSIINLSIVSYVISRSFQICGKILLKIKTEPFRIFM